jgi:hypothetical protein
MVRLLVVSFDCCRVEQVSAVLLQIKEIRFNLVARFRNRRYPLTTLLLLLGFGDRLLGSVVRMNANIREPFVCFAYE